MTDQPKSAPRPDKCELRRWHEGSPLPTGRTPLDVWRCSACTSDFVALTKGTPGKCPVCGSGAWVRRFFGPSGTVPAGSRLRLSVKSPNGVVKEEQFITFKKAGRSGLRARERLVVDHRDPTKTVKRHFVEEWSGSEWVIVHEHVEEHPAKHRD